MSQDNSEKPTRRARILSNLRWVVVFAVSFVLFYQAFGPEPIQRSPIDNSGLRLTTAESVPPSIQSFADPAAQHLAALGHALMERPMERLYVARELEALTETPEALGDDPSAYLTLRAAYWQLRRDPEVSGSIDTARILWDTAEQLEMQNHVSSVARFMDRQRQVQ